jgi:protein SCO1/2
MVGLTGTPQQVQDVCKHFRVYFSKANANLGEKPDEDYLVDHSIFFYLIDPSGKFHSYYGKALSVQEITKRVGTAVATQHGLDPVQLGFQPKKPLWKQLVEALGLRASK